MPRQPKFTESTHLSPEIKKTFTDRFIKKIKDSLIFFQSKPATTSSDIEKKLTGRIYELQKTVNEVIDQLHLIKAELSQELDDRDLYELVEAIVDPLIKNVDRINRKNHQDDEEITYRRYSAWIEKAKIWVQIRSQSKEKDMITHAVIKHTIENFHEIVDRDLQIIQDYQDHMIQANITSDEASDKFFSVLHERLEPYLESLFLLKSKPVNLKLADLPEWKNKMNKLRETYFEGALHVIDQVIQNIHPESPDLKEHDHLIDIFSKVAELEEDIPVFKKELDFADLSNHQIKQLYLEKLQNFEKDLALINIDLSLTPELTDRVEALINLTSKIHKYLR